MLELERLLQPTHEPALVQAYATSSKELVAKRADLATKREAAAAHQDALTQATAEQKAFQDGRAKRLQAIWEYKA